MTCANCVAHVADGLRSVPGVLDVNVDLASRRARVNMIPGAVAIADLRHAVEDVGYEVLDAGDAGEGLVEREPEHGHEKSGLVSKLASIWKR
jgi:P-type Cu+ transporter